MVCRCLLDLRGAFKCPLQFVVVDLPAGDLLVVDRSLMPKPGGILLIEYSGELRLCRYNEVLAQALDDTCLLWGVVTYAIHKTS